MDKRAEFCNGTLTLGVSGGIVPYSAGRGWMAHSWSRGRDESGERRDEMDEMDEMLTLPCLR
jgi:hypothetical protein